MTCDNLLCELGLGTLSIIALLVVLVIEEVIRRGRQP